MITQITDIEKQGNVTVVSCANRLGNNYMKVGDSQ